MKEKGLYRFSFKICVLWLRRKNNKIELSIEQNVQVSDTTGDATRTEVKCNM